MDLFGIVKIIIGIFNAAIPVMVGLGTVYFIWGVVAYVIADSEQAKKTGKDRIIYGIAALAIIISMWGLVNVIINTFGLSNASNPTHPIVTKGCDLNAPINTLKDLAGYINCTIKDSIIPFLFAAALAIFVWGVVNFFLIGAGEEAKRTQGKQFMIWGLVALTVMLSFWGLVRILGRTLQLF